LLNKKFANVESTPSTNYGCSIKKPLHRSYLDNMLILPAHQNLKFSHRSYSISSTCDLLKIKPSLVKPMQITIQSEVTRLQNQLIDTTDIQTDQINASSRFHGLNFSASNPGLKKADENDAGYNQASMHHPLHRKQSLGSALYYQHCTGLTNLALARKQLRSNLLLSKDSFQELLKDDTARGQTLDFENFKQIQKNGNGSGSRSVLKSALKNKRNALLKTEESLMSLPNRSGFTSKIDGDFTPGTQRSGIASPNVQSNHVNSKLGIFSRNMRQDSIRSHLMMMNQIKNMPSVSNQMFQPRNRKTIMRPDVRGDECLPEAYINLLNKTGEAECIETPASKKEVRKVSFYPNKLVYTYQES
jgi:hypothetical protein